MRRWLSVVVLAASAIADVSTAVAADTGRDIEIREADRRRGETHLALTSKYWSWQGELVRKGKLGPAHAHPWLGKLGSLRGKEAGDYLAGRKLKAENDSIYLSIEGKPGSSDDLQWIGELGGRVADKKGSNAIVEMPVAAMDRLLRDGRVGKVRPLASDAERAEQRTKRKNSRGAVPAAGEKTEKWRSPIEDRDVEVLKGAVAVNFKGGIGPEQAEEILSSYGCWIAEENPDLTFARYIVRCRDEDDLPQLLEWLGADPDTAYVDVVGIAQPVLTPNDPRYPEQWSLNNTGSVPQLSGTPDADIDAPEGWGRDTGANNVIAIIDTGVDLNHQDLSSKIWANPDEVINGADDDGNGVVDDIRGWDFGDNDNNPMDSETIESGLIIQSGHGTYVAGVAAAASNNGVGIAGVNWSAKIMALKIRDSSGIMTSARAANAVRYAARKGASVINLSLTITPQFVPDMENALAEADNRGSLIVAASGNNGADTVSYPASNIFTVAVGATDNKDRRATFSNGGMALALVAPGADVLTTRIGNQYTRVNGTSFAAPHVAGAAAFIRSLAPALTTAEGRELLKRNTDLVSGQVGFSIGYGHGRLNLDKVILAAQVAAIGTPPPPPPPVPLQVSSAAAIDARYVDVFFNKPLDPISSVVSSNYAINPSLEVKGVFLMASGRSVRLKTGDQAGGFGYTVTVTGVKDSSGSLISTPNSAAFSGLSPSGGESFLWRITTTANESAGGSKLTFSQGFLATFSNDGLRAVFSKEAPPLPPTFQTRFFLHTANTAGGGSTQIIPEDSDPRHSDVDADWSPVSNRIVFAGMRTVGNGFSQNIYTVNSDGSGIFRLTPLTQSLQQRDPTWSPDASQIAFIETGGNIFKMNANGTGKTLLVSGNFKIGLSWHPSGAPIAFQQQDPSGDKIYTVNPDGSGLILRIHDGRTPIWSPDGQRIAFARSGAVIVANADGTNEQFVAGGFLFPRIVDWLADGIRVSASDNAGTFLVAAPPVPPFAATTDWRLGIAYSIQNYVSPYSNDLTPRYGGALSNLQTTLEDDSDLVVTTFTSQTAGNLLSGDITGVLDTVPPAPPSNLLANGGSPSPWSKQKSVLVTMSPSPDPAGIAGAFFKSFTPPLSDDDGEFFFGQNSFPVELSPANGENQLFVWLKDRAGNASAANFSTITIRFDDIAPVSLAVAPATAATGPIQVSFQTSDSGEGGVPPSGSGGGSAQLWFRTSAQSWAIAGPPAAGSSGTLSFAPAGDDAYEFYTQASDLAGNLEPVPVATTPAKAATVFDASPPVLANIQLPLISFTQAHVTWQTDDQATGLVEYGTTTALGRFRSTALGREHLAVLDCSLLSPATIYYRVTATNLTGLTTVSSLASFATPPLVTTPTDLFGVIDPFLPIDVQVTNPDIMNATFTIDGQAGVVSFSTATGFQIFLDTGITGSGLQTLRIVMNGFTYETQFLVDNATRSVRLARAALDAAGVMTDSTTTPGSSVADTTLGEAANEIMAGQGSRLHLGFYSAIDPVAPAVIADLFAAAGSGAGQILLSWTTVGDDEGVGTAMKYDLRRATYTIDDANFASATPVSLSTYPAIAGTVQQALVSGLADGTTYHFAIKALDELLNVSLLGNIASAKTLEVARSADLTNGQPTIEFLSFVPGVSVTQVSTTTTFPALALATSAAAAQGLIFYSTLFDIVSPDPSLPGGATIQFRYADPADPTFESNLRVYEFKESLDQWVLIADIGPQAGQDLFFLPIPGLSLYAIMFRDALPPITSLEPRGGRQFIGANGALFSSTATIYGLTTRDPSQGGYRAAGVSRSEYRVDSSSIPFTALPASASFSLLGGFHTVQFRSVDNAGNIEPLRSAVVAVDAAAPVASISADALTVPSPGGLAILSSTATVTVTIRDSLLPGGAVGSGSGLESVAYALDGGPLTASSSTFSVFLGTGAHYLSLLARDNVGNLLDTTTAPLRVVVGDALPPRTTAEFGAPSAGTDPVYLTSATPIVLRSWDDLVQSGDAAGLGVAFQEAALTALSSGTPRTQRFSTALSTFFASVEADGFYALGFFAEDVAGNREVLRRSMVAVDNTAPVAGLFVHGASHVADDLLFISSTSSLEVTAADPVSGGVAAGIDAIHYRVDAGSITPFELFVSSFALPGGTHVVESRARDRVGNESAAAARAVFVDTVAPVSTLVIGSPQADLGGGVTLVSPFTPLLVVSTDSASGVHETLVSLDGAPFAASSVTFTVPGEGARSLRFFARDNVLNAEELRVASLVVDATPPVSLLLSPSPAARGVDQAFGSGLVPVVATIADLHLSSYTLEFAAGVEAQGAFSAVATGTVPVTRQVIARWDASALSGFYTLRLSAADSLGAVSVSTATVFIGDPVAVLMIKNQEDHGDKDQLLDKPEGVAVAGDGSIFVANTGKDQVLRFGPQGSLLGTFDGLTTLMPEKHGADKGGKAKDDKGKNDGGDETGKAESITFHKPTGLAVDDAAKIYVADRNNNRIVILSSTGTVLRSVGRTNPQGRFIPGKGPGEFNKPTGVAVSSARVAVADRNNGRVQVFDRDFSFLFQIKLDEVAPGGVPYLEGDDDEDSAAFGVAWVPDGTLFVSDEGNHRVLVFDAQGSLLATVGSEGASLGLFRRPKGVAAGALNYLYVADRDNKRVQKFDAFHNAVLAAGASLGLEQPTGLALDAGFLYVADRKTNRVLKLGLPAPVVVVTAPPAASNKVKKCKVSGDGGKITRPDRVTVDVPRGALAQELELSIEPESTADPEVEDRKKRAKERSGLAAVSEGVEYGPEGTVFNAPVTITLVYDPKTLPAGTREEDLKVHYWNPAKGDWEAFPSEVDKELRTVSAKTLHFSLYQVMGAAGTGIAAVDDVSVRAAYAFPNPARNSGVTFRFQPGLVDSVDVRVYDVSGRRIHESGDFRYRGLFDDSNGLGAQHTYDHLWSVSGIGSGVYTYIMEAKRAGQETVRKTGKVGIIK